MSAAAALLSLPNGLQVATREEPNGWVLVAWRVPKWKSAFAAEYDVVEPNAEWRKRRFATTDALIEAIVRDNGVPR